MSKKTIKNKRIYIGPCEIAGYYLNLTKGFKELGFNVDYITYNNHHFNYEKDINLPFLIKIARVFNKFKNNNRNTFTRLLIALPGEFFSFIWAVTAIFKYDVFIFGFGQSLLRYNLDLYILKALKKTVISNLAHGSEARPAYLNGAIQNKHHNIFPALKKILKMTKVSKYLVSRHEKLSTYIIGAPFSSSHFSSKKFINFFMLGIPSLETNLKDFRTDLNVKKLKQSVRILHSPSHPSAKGTLYIKKAILNLQKKGHEIEFILVNGVSNLEVIEEIKKCDFIVDQIFSDTPLSGFAAEAAFYAKPAVVGGYGFEYLKSFIIPEMFPPSKICHPDKIEVAIESLIVDKNNRYFLGNAAHNFVLTKWNSIEVAKRYIRIIEDDIPEKWWLDPKEVIYIEGMGQSLKITKENLKNIINAYGISALQLSHNPKLEEAFLKFSNS